MNLVLTVGAKQIARRSFYEVARKSGWLKYRYPYGELANWYPADRDRIIESIQQGRGFFFGSDWCNFTLVYRHRFPALTHSLTVAADRIVEGEQLYFSKLQYRFHGLPDWFRNPFTDQIVPPSPHWSSLGFYSPHYGDLKFILEPARFGCVYLLVRAYQYSGNETYPAFFWRLLEDWIEKNPPQAGPLWICGQEAAFRIMAWCFGLYGFVQSPHTTPERILRLIAEINAHADRIEGTIAYARSQKNNHALSEAVGLWTVGTLFPELERAKRWQKLGKRVLENEICCQIYDDGSYVQHSNNYHRVMMHDILWALQLGEINGEYFSQEIYQRLHLATKFLYQMTDIETGLVPNYGANDGAFILPLSSCDYSDFRPVLQAAHYLLQKKFILPSGAWDEDILWLFGPTAFERLHNPPTNVDTCRQEAKDANIQGRFPTSYPSGGYYILHGHHSWAMIRCARYRDRPSHADQLHLDLWWNNINIACDAGSYLYNGEPPWDNALASTAVHNTVGVDRQDQMIRGGRFLWLHWAQGAVWSQLHSNSGQIVYWEGSHDGYQRLKPPVTHRRGVLRLGEDHWLVLDTLHSSGTHHYRLHWLFPDIPYTWDDKRGHLSLQTLRGAYSIQMAALSGSCVYSLTRADACSPRGWRSPYYGYREPALSLDLVQEASSACFWTLFGPASSRIEINATALGIATDLWQALLHFEPALGESWLTSIHVVGALTDSLKVARCISC